MRIVIAIDSFKGCVSSLQAGEAAAKGLREILPKETQIMVYPVGDGGEGTLEALAAQHTGSMQFTEVNGPLGKKTLSRWYRTHTGSAIIELAAACGLTLLSPEERDIMHAGTKGLGELIETAFEAGCRNFTIALGGSASNDAGLGALMAIGLKVFDASGQEISNGCGESLAKIVSVDTEGLRKFAGCKFVCLADVDTPFMDAPAVYGPQKGANQQEIKELVEGMDNFASVSLCATGKSMTEAFGSGAAGGVAGAFACYLGAKCVPGAEKVLSGLDFSGASLIITGEGHMDSQTLCGKMPFAVMKKGLCENARVIALTGKADDTEEFPDAGFDEIREICTEKLPLQVMMNPKICLQNIENTAKAIAKELN
ncbi:MAG: glycerate kinase [Muribaculaceae bacterium]|nr:glycerate kinase [Muribaculaceae bacterium]